MLNALEREFVRQHLDEDPAVLALSAHRYPEVPVSSLLPFIKALRNIRDKVPSWFLFDIDIPPPLAVEQASSEVMARFKAELFNGRRMADLSGGMGVDAFFWSRSFQEVLYLEQDDEIARSAQHNFARLDASNIRVVVGNAEQFIARCSTSFDLIYVDPARRTNDSRRIFRLEDCSPNVVALHPDLLRISPRVLIKASPLLDLSRATAQLRHVERIWVVSVAGEVKEVLLLLGREASFFESTPIEAVVLSHASKHTFSFTPAEERSTTPHYGPPQHFLYEPDAALLKAGAFKSFAVRFGLTKLHPHAHLYTSARQILEIPGRSFRIEAVVKYDRKAVARYLPEYKANIAVRHFPDSVEQVYRRLGLSPGGDIYLFGTTSMSGEKILLLCRKTNTIA